jgi:hypothetical protein
VVEEQSFPLSQEVEKEEQSLPLLEEVEAVSSLYFLVWSSLDDDSERNLAD